MISLNCLLTSSIISNAASPTACIASAENTNGNEDPISSPAITVGLLISKVKPPTVSLNAANNANEVNAADPIAKPLPIAAVVFPTASNLSVLSRTSFGSSAISAIPPALSAIGP